MPSEARLEKFGQPLLKNPLLWVWCMPPDDSDVHFIQGKGIKNHISTPHFRVTSVPMPHPLSPHAPPPYAHCPPLLTY